MTCETDYGFPHAAIEVQNQEIILLLHDEKAGWGGGGGGGERGVAQSLEGATPGERVLGWKPAVAARSLLVGSVSV